jgi:hypothetical protein
MAERRPLIEGLKSPPPEAIPALEERFVYGGKADSDHRPLQPKTARPAASPTTPQSSVSEGKNQPLNAHSRVPLTTRIRSDYASALKRASLERQLDGVHPNTLQEILETALEPWLRENGYLS